jgi:succinoglycan biosynthesis protein ExoM
MNREQWMGVLKSGASPVPMPKSPRDGTQQGHISVCVCTYRRPEPLLRLLRELRDQETGGRFTYSIVIVDNDRQQSAEPVVRAFAASCPVMIKYCLEPQQGIARARNRAVENAAGDLIAFIDDDEFPIKSWLLNLYETLQRYRAAGALGPVQRHFDEQPPKWLLKGNFYCKPTHPTGFMIGPTEGRTSNLLFDRALIEGDAPVFRPELRSGEDLDFTSKMMQRGHCFVWCDEAIVYEVIPPARWRRAYMLRKALLRGSCTVFYSTFGVRSVAESVIAVPVYAICLPVAAILGQHRFMDLLIRLCDHIGKLSALMGVNPVKEPYVIG